MASNTTAMATWGDLNIALNTLVKERIIVGYKTSRADKGAGAAIDVTIAPGSDQAVVVKRVRDLLSGTFADATIRTKVGP